ncbi:ARM repeat-containing protein [Atractiella rhizophila]|nr:ARM repeat-containing protein [Atractiella rhizophila]
MRSPSPPPNFSTPPMPTSSSPILSRHPSLPALSMGIGISGHARRLSSEAHSATSVGSHSPRSPRGFVFGSSKKKNRARERSNSRDGPREEDVEEAEGEEKELRTRDSLEELGGGGGSGGGSPHTPSPHGRLFPPLPYAHDTATSTSSPSSSSPSHPSLTFLNNALVGVGTSGGSAGSGSGSGGYSPPFGLTSFSFPSVPLTSHHGHTTVTTSGSPTRSFHSAHLPPSSLSISTFATTGPPSPPVPIGATASPESPTLYFNKDALRTRDSLEIFDPMLLPPSAMEERDRDGAADGERDRDRDAMDIVHEEMDAGSLPYLLRGPSPALSMGEETVKDFHPPSTLHPPQPQPPSPMVAAFPPLSVDSLGLSMDESSLTGSGLEADEMFGWKKEDEMELTLLERIIVCGKSSIIGHRIHAAENLPVWLSVATADEEAEAEGKAKSGQAEPAAEKIGTKEAREYILPLIESLVMDDFPVRFAMATGMAGVMAFFFKNCPLKEAREGDAMGEQDNEISIHAFTPILLALLSDDSDAGRVAECARDSIVSFFDTMLPSISLPLSTQDMIREELVRSLVGPLVDGKDEEEEEEESEDSETKGEGEEEEGSLREMERREREREEREMREEVEVGSQEMKEGKWDEGGAAVERPIDLAPMFAINPLLRATSRLQHQPSGLSAFSSDGQSLMEDESGAFSRLSGMQLISSFAQLASPLPLHLLLELLAHVSRMETDPVWIVRREAVGALQQLTMALPKETIPTHVLPIFDSFSQDAVWHVRQGTVSIFPDVCERLDERDVRRAKVVRGVEKYEKDQSTTVRSELLSVAGRLIYLFFEDPDGVPQCLVDVFLNNDQPNPISFYSSIHSPFPITMHSPLDPRKLAVQAYNLPAVVLTLGQSRWPELRGLFQTLTKSTDGDVHRSLKASLHEIAKIIGKEQTEKDLLPYFDRKVARVEDEEEGEVEVIFENLGTFLAQLDPLRCREMLERIVKMWTMGLGNKWRVREKIGNSLPLLIQSGMFEGSKWTKEDPLMDLLELSLQDNVNAVREAGVLAVHSFHKASEKDVDLKNRLLIILKDLAQSSKFRRRVTFVRPLGTRACFN